VTHRNTTKKNVGLKADSVIKLNNILCLVRYRLISIAQAIELRKILKPNLLQFPSRNNDMRESLYGLSFVNFFDSKTSIQKMTLSKLLSTELMIQVFGRGKYQFLPHSKHTLPHL